MHTLVIDTSTSNMILDAYCYFINDASRTHLVCICLSLWNVQMTMDIYLGKISFYYISGAGYYSATLFTGLQGLLRSNYKLCAQEAKLPISFHYFIYSCACYSVIVRFIGMWHTSNGCSVFLHVVLLESVP